MSRAERRTVPPAPRLRRVLREGASDLYYNSWRFLGANTLIGGLLVVILLVAVGTFYALGLLLFVVVPCAGMMRMATSLVREGHTDFGEVWSVIRRPWQVLAIGAVQLALSVILVVDIAIGASLQSLFGTFLMVTAIYGLLIGWTLAVAMWPLLLDPLRDGDSIRRRIRLAALLVIAHPLRIGGLALLIGVLLLVAGLAVMPLITFALAFAWVVAARYVLPAADRLEGRATLEVGD